MKHILLATALLTALSSSVCLADPTITLITKTDNAYGLKNHNTWAASSHDITIVNDTDSDKIYSYGYSICVEGHDCVSKNFMVTVKPFSTFNKHADLQHEAVYKKDRAYDLVATTRVSATYQEAKALVIIRP